MNDNLAPVFLDNKPVSLNDPKPKLSAILSASGKPDTTEVKWLQFQPNTPGKSLRSEEILDRTTDPSKPIYLTSGKAQGSGKPSTFGSDPKHAQSGDKTTEGKEGKPSTRQGDESGMRDDREGGGEGEARRHTGNQP
jgi:hypothetical protein